MRTAIVTDSTSDLPPALADAAGVQVLPTVLILDGESYLDGSGMSREEFYTRLPTLTNLPSTAAPAAGAFQELYQRLFDQGFQEIVSIHLASALSGVINVASTAAQAFESRVHVVDSFQLSMGLGYQALAAALAARRGETVEGILAAITHTRQRLHLVAMLDTLTYIHRSGRVSWARAMLGSLLNIKPFVGVRDGRVTREGEARTRRKGLERLLEMLRSLGPLERLAMLHTNAEADARQVLALLQPELETEPVFVNVTTIIGTHVGPGAVGYVAVTR